MVNSSWFLSETIQTVCGSVAQKGSLLWTTGSFFATQHPNYMTTRMSSTAPIFAEIMLYGYICSTVKTYCIAVSTCGSNKLAMHSSLNPHRSIMIHIEPLQPGHLSSFKPRFVRAFSTLASIMQWRQAPRMTCHGRRRRHCVAYAIGSLKGVKRS